MSTSDEKERSALQDYLCFALYSANHAMNRVYQPLLKEMELTYPQYLVMTVLWDRDDQLVGEIGRQVFLESNTLTPLIKRLEVLGYVRRQRDPEDERQVRVSLTAEGRQLKQAAACIPEEILKATGLTVSELTDLTRKVDTLRSTLAANA